MPCYKFLIYISYGYSIPIGNPLEKEILKQNHQVYWFSDCQNEMKALVNKSNTFSTIKEVIQYEPQIVLCITDSVPDFISGIKVQIFHGFNAEKRSFKKDHFRIRGLFDLYCTQGASTTKIFKKLQERDPHFEVIETGWSKMDPLFPIEKKKINKLPVIFIASTFTERLSLALREDVYQKIKQLSVTGKYRFIMVLHPKLSDSIREKWKVLENQYFQFYDTTNLIPLFRKSDVMLSDTTSAIQEFGLQGKPIVTFNHHIPKPWLINITTIDELESALERAISNPEKILEKLADFNKELHPYCDGRSSKRVVDATIGFLKTDKSYLKKKPINLVRKIKMRILLKHFSLRSYRKPYTLH